MRSVNKVVLMGHLATDPENTVLKSGQTVTKFKIATNRDWKSSSGEKQESTDFHRVVSWNKLAEICSKYLKKGFAVYLEGRIMNHVYTAANGEKRSITEIVADVVNFINYKKHKEEEQINLIEMPAQ